MVPPPPLPFDPQPPGPASPAVTTLTGPAIGAAVAGTPGWRLAGIGAANGHGNARPAARIMSAVARGGQTGGVRLPGPGTIDLIFRDQRNGTDLAPGVPPRPGTGYGLPRPDLLPWLPDERIRCRGGRGGSMIIMDTGRRMTISSMMNKMAPGITGSDPSATHGQAIYHAVTQ